MGGAERAPRGRPECAGGEDSAGGVQDPGHGPGAATEVLWTWTNHSLLWSFRFSICYLRGELWFPCSPHFFSGLLHGPSVQRAQVLGERGPHATAWSTQRLLPTLPRGALGPGEPQDLPALLAVRFGEEPTPLGHVPRAAFGCPRRAGLCPAGESTQPEDHSPSNSNRNDSAPVEVS